MEISPNIIKTAFLQNETELWSLCESWKQNAWEAQLECKEMATPFLTHSITVALAGLGPHHNLKQPLMCDATQDLVDKWRRARIKGKIDCFLGEEDLSSSATVLHFQPYQKYVKAALQI